MWLSVRGALRISPGEESGADNGRSSEDADKGDRTKEPYHGKELPMSVYIEALVFTIIIEIAVAAAMGYRSRAQLQAVALINGLTNPALNFVIWVMMVQGIQVTVAAVLLLESIVVIVEWRLLAYFLRGSEARLLLLSLTMNTASFLTGELLFA